MLLRFTVDNVLCFGTETIFSMVATADEAHPNHVIKKSEGEPARVLRAAALYGANAHGKTRLVEALGLLKTLVTEGTRPQKKLPIKPFRLSAKCMSKPSRFEILFHHKGVYYDYGLVADCDYVHEEWL
ncbi:MAG: AAA family ATPase [Rhodospirillaceae bacterium]